MFIKLLLFFTLVPVIEVYVLFEAGRLIGLPLTITLIILTGIAGAYLAQSQGFQVLIDIRQSIEQGGLPAEGLAHAALILTGGILLLTPGFCTDLIGFILLTPLTRQILKDRIFKWLRNHLAERDI
ncbi:FxsA family protein [Desulfuromonas sp. AOP6]|uniref:FxsA family protein n=1 Tax=Desulfuromonas sp. AOP6 TaxID=1566351 RepID=UPI001274952C|nr:FxsA family protein [Desulfuromonas sp. AOP6]BCA79822.1 membrane protein FxsA [Desulfuromonas sp. AOP6]